MKGHFRTLPWRILSLQIGELCCLLIFQRYTTCAKSLAVAPLSRGHGITSTKKPTVNRTKAERLYIYTVQLFKNLAEPS